MKLSPSALPSIPLRRVVLRGSPFKNPRTVCSLLKLCIPKLSDERAAYIVNNAQVDDIGTTVIVCHKNEASIYTRNLIENGLEADITNY